MKLSLVLQKIIKALIGAVVLDLFLLTFCLILGSIFDILHTFTWFGFKIIVLPFSLLAFFISLIYFSKKEEIELIEIGDENETEYSSRMEKFHQPENK